jgi:NTP pyrophosphatase (non-canonical NTP hydrolase)
MPYKVHNLMKLHTEHQRQIDKFGSQLKLDRSMWAVILMEEVGEVCRIICDEDRLGDPIDSKHYEEELIQVAAVAMSALENWQGKHALEGVSCENL